MDENRRRYLRKVPDDLTFIQIERDEVGKVLNVSEGGLSFSSVTPVPRNLPLYFWFSFNLKDRIEAMGEVAWTDISRTVGGLRFTQLSKASREQIQKWLSRLRSEQVPVEELVPKLVTADEPVRMTTKAPDRVAQFVSKARGLRPMFSPKERGSGNVLVATLPAREIEPLVIEPTPARPSPPKPSGYHILSLQGEDYVGSKDADNLKLKPFSLPLRGLESLAELVPLQRHLSAKKRQLLGGFFLGVLLSAVVTAAAVKYWNFFVRADNAKPGATESLTAKNDRQSLPPAPVPETKPNSSAAGIFSNTPTATKGTTPSLTKTAGNTGNPFGESRPQNMVANASRPSAYTPLKPQSGGSASAKKSSMTPMQLWKEVQAGDGKAAVELAELYIKGEGVPRNCQQARVLLLVASEKKNAAAIKRLQELDKDAKTCP